MNKIAQIQAKIGGVVALSLFSLANIAPADAATFDLTGPTGPGAPGPVSTFSVSNTVTATFTDPSNNDLLQRDGQGFRVATFAFGGNPQLTEFEVVFSGDVILTGYEVTEVGSNIPTDAGITVTVGGETSEEGNPFTVGVTTFMNQIFVAAGQVATFTYTGSNPSNGSSILWNNLEVATVPEPASLVGLLGVGALGFATRKRK